MDQLNHLVKKEGSNIIKYKAFMFNSKVVEYAFQLFNAHLSQCWIHFGEHECAEYEILRQKCHFHMDLNLLLKNKNYQSVGILLKTSYSYVILKRGLTFNKFEK